MKLSEIFTQLSYGELSQISLGGAQAGLINANNYQHVVAHVNLGLLALYKRFPLKQGRLSFLLETGRTFYPLNTDDGVQFVDLDSEFMDDISKIETVHTTEGEELSVNNAADAYTCETPSSTVLRVSADIVNKAVDLPSHLLTSQLVVSYRANHPLIVVNGSFNPAQVDIELPYSHLEPLLLFVASRANNPIGMPTGNSNFNMGNNYAAKYEQACQQLETLNLRVDQGSQNTRMYQNGWV